MKAIRVRQFGDPSVLQLEDVPDPQPGPEQVVVGIKAIGVNPVDTYMRAGTYARNPSLPFTPGTDTAGVVLSIGPNVKRVSTAQRVYTAGTLTGAYAERALCDESTVFPLPDHASLEQGASIHIPYGTAFRALFHRAHALGGETILIHGASGGVGIAAVQLARAAGLRVIGTAGSERGLKLVVDEGAHVALDHKKPNHFEDAMAATEGKGYDVIVEMLANVNLGRDLPLLARGGRVVVVGNRGVAEINPRDAMMREASILGMSLWNIAPSELHSIHSALGAGLENRSLRPVIGQKFPLAEAARAHVAVLEPNAHGKIILIP